MKRVNSIAIAPGVSQKLLLKPILVGGAIAGTLDQISAFISSGWNVPRIVAAGLLGPQVIHGREVWVWTLGLALHYFIAFSAATVYCLASRRLEFLKEHFLVSGLFYGIAVFLVMYFVVMPLCAFHYKIQFLILGAISVVLNTTVDLIVVGFASLIAQRLSRNPKLIERQRTGSGVGMIGLGIYVAASK